MNYGGGGRHYRVARNEIEKESVKDGFYIEKEKKNKFFLFAASVSIVVFIKGIVLGYCLAKHNK